MTLPPLLKLIPSVRNYVWGGRSLLALAPETDSSLPIAEIWAIHENNPVASGDLAGRALAELFEQYPEQLCGTAARKYPRFPLLIKLLDCADWLSLQVHPNDEQARQLEGAQFVGKTEAWHILDAKPNAQLIAGVQAGVTQEALRAAISGGDILALAEYHQVRAGDTALMPAGTIHALGPGLLVYEVQQSSDLTYRVFDWNRPQGNGRVLHIEKSIAVANPNLRGQVSHAPQSADASLAQNEYFHLELLSTPQARDTRGQTFHALTVIEGEAQISAGRETAALKKFETIFVPAQSGRYRLEGRFKALCSSLP